MCVCVRLTILLLLLSRTLWPATADTIARMLCVNIRVHCCCVDRADTIVYLHIVASLFLSCKSYSTAAAAAGTVLFLVILFKCFYIFVYVVHTRPHIQAFELGPFCEISVKFRYHVQRSFGFFSF